MNVGTCSILQCHVYKDPVIGRTVKDRHNVHDVYAVTVVEGDTVVGHVSWRHKLISSVNGANQWWDKLIN